MEESIAASVYISLCVSVSVSGNFELPQWAASPSDPSSLNASQNQRPSPSPKLVCLCCSHPCANMRFPPKLRKARPSTDCSAQVATLQAPIFIFLITAFPEKHVRGEIKKRKLSRASAVCKRKTLGQPPKIRKIRGAKYHRKAELRSP